jgi:hypothetical protein
MPWRPEFCPRLVHVQFVVAVDSVVDKVAMGQAFLSTSDFPYHLSFYQCFILISHFRASIIGPSEDTIPMYSVSCYSSSIKNNN